MKLWDIIMDIGVGYLLYRFLDYVFVSETSPILLTIVALSFFAELIELRPKIKDEGGGGSKSKPASP